MRFGLWMAVATADESSRVLQEHPEWLARDRHGQPNRHPMPGAVTMCLDSGYYEHIRGKIAGAIQRYGVELLKLDLSTVRNVYAPGVHPGCFAEGHGHRSPGESHVRILDRLLALIQDLGARHPRCLMDLSYEAYGVVDGTDLALTKVADQCWFSNITTPNETSLRREIYERARVTRPWTLNYGGAVLNDPDTPSYGLFTALTGHGVFWGDLTDLDDEARETYRRWFAWVREERARDDFYAHYRVSDVFPPPDGAAARDYRHAVPTGRYGVPSLGVHPPGFESETEHAGKTWDGVARISSRGEGPIFLFRPGACLSPYFTLRIPWLEAGVRYRLTDVNESRDLGVWEGARLAMEGLEVRLDEPRHAKVIVLRREGG
jgi:hypothetical protein